MKQSEVKNLSVAELEQKLIELKKSYAEMKLAHAISPLDNPLTYPYHSQNYRTYRK